MVGLEAGLGYMPCAYCATRSKWSDSSTSDHTGCVNAVTAAGTRARTYAMTSEFRHAMRDGVLTSSPSERGCPTLSSGLRLAGFRPRTRGVVVEIQTGRSRGSRPPAD